MGMFDELKTVGHVLQEAGKIEQYGQILAAQEKLLDMQKRIIELESENKTLREDLELKKKLVFERNAYWIVDGTEKVGPFCSKCKDSQDKLIRMRLAKYAFGWAFCPNCEKVTPNEQGS